MTWLTLGLANRPWRRHALHLGLIVTGYSCLVVLFTYPQVLKLTHSVGLHHDSLFSVWRLAWVAHQLRAAPLNLFDANIFFPQPGTLAYSDAMLLPAVLLAPLAWIGVPPITVYNLALLASFVASATAGTVLGWRITGRLGAGVIAGLIFGFAPHRFEHFEHLELQLNWWMPLSFLALHRVLATGQRRSYAALAFLLSFQFLSCIYHGVFLSVCLIGAAFPINGYSGFYPQDYVRTLEYLRGFPDGMSLARLDAVGATHLILHREGWSGRLNYDSTLAALQALDLGLILRVGHGNNEVAVFSMSKRSP